MASDTGAPVSGKPDDLPQPPQAAGSRSALAILVFILVLLFLAYGLVKTSSSSPAQAFSPPDQGSFHYFLPPLINTILGVTFASGVGFLVLVLKHTRHPSFGSM